MGSKGWGEKSSRRRGQETPSRCRAEKINQASLNKVWLEAGHKKASSVVRCTRACRRHGAPAQASRPSWGPQPSRAAGRLPGCMR